MQTLLQDVRYALRAFARTPGFTLAAVLSLALGVGANTAIFSVASALLLRPLPYTDAHRLVILWNRSPGLGIAEDWFSTAQYFDIRNGHGGFEELAIAIGANYNLTGDGEPERIGTIRMSSNLLPMLGVRPVLGRLLEPAEDRPGRTGTAAELRVERAPRAPMRDETSGSLLFMKERPNPPARLLRLRRQGETEDQAPQQEAMHTLTHVVDIPQTYLLSSIVCARRSSCLMRSSTRPGRPWASGRRPTR